MNRRFASLAFAAALVPTAALAQSAPPPGPMGAPSAEQRSTMEQMHQQFAQMHQQARAQMLAALTPQHRAFVGNVVSQLAVAVTPNRQAAAAQIDAALTPSEKQSILNIHTTLKNNARGMMAAQRARFEASMSPDQRAAMQSRHAGERGGWESREHVAQDPGEILLRTLFGGEGGHVGMHP